MRHQKSPGQPDNDPLVRIEVHDKAVVQAMEDGGLIVNNGHKSLVVDEIATNAHAHLTSSVAAVRSRLEDRN